MSTYWEIEEDHRGRESFLSADAMIQHIKTPMGEARPTEDLLNAAADRTAGRPTNSLLTTNGSELHIVKGVLDGLPHARF